MQLMDLQASLAFTPKPHKRAVMPFSAMLFSAITI
jgi:hypothetical protein